MISQVKLIAEPWDLGEGGYQVGNFPPGWAEWNGRYRDAIRRFWKGDERPGRATSRYRLTGSSDLYEQGGRRPSASINFVTAHDGFTLADLVTYNDKHNEANGEDNRDGTDDNAVVELRRRGPDRRSGRSSRCASARCATSWRRFCCRRACRCSSAETRSAGRSTATTTPTARTTSSRGRAGRCRAPARASSSSPARSSGCASTIPVFHRRLFFQGRRIHGSAVKDLSWFRPDGKEMMEDEWNNGFTRCLGLRLAGDAIDEIDEKGQPIVGDTFLLLLNAHHEARAVHPARPSRARSLGARAGYARLGRRPAHARLPRRRRTIRCEARSLAVLRLRSPRTRA